MQKIRSFGNVAVNFADIIKDFIDFNMVVKCTSIENLNRMDCRRSCEEDLSSITNCNTVVLTMSRQPWLQSWFPIWTHFKRKEYKKNVTSGNVHNVIRKDQTNQKLQKGRRRHRTAVVKRDVVSLPVGGKPRRQDNVCTRKAKLISVARCYS